MAATKWSDDKFLDNLRSHCDAAADECVAKLDRTSEYGKLFAAMRQNSCPVPDGTPDPLVDFFAATYTLPAVETDRRRFLDGVDHARVERGEAVFMTHAVVSSLVLLAKAMPEGYASPPLSKLLNLSGNLKSHPYKRLLGVLQMVVNVMSPRAFESTGRAIVTAQQIRLMHAGIRNFTRQQWDGYPAYVEKYGLPVNLEDMLGTIMGLSLLVIRGMKELQVGLSDQQAEDYYYSWRVYAQMMGIHPPGQRDSNEWVPADLAEANEFYDSYERRHYVEAAENPDGVELANQNLNMLEVFIPPALRRLGVRGAAAYYMADLIGEDGCRRVGLNLNDGHSFRRSMLLSGLKGWVTFWRSIDKLGAQRSLHEGLSRLLFNGLIRAEYGGEATFEIPESLDQVRAQVDTDRSILRWGRLTQ